MSMRVTLVLVDPVFYKFTLIQFRSCSTVVQMTVKVTSVYAVCVPLFYLYEVSVLLFHHGVAAISDCICVCVLQIFKCDNEACPRPGCYRSCGSSKEDIFSCDRQGCGGKFRVLR